ncbi:hypothetical protein PINS_up000714 [Pythium insidiosum]|nr:hypothetical protein PINS_up000714 [Pythium insidiosum]
MNCVQRRFACLTTAVFVVNMSLLCDYSDSSEDEAPPAPAVRQTNHQEELPSLDDLFGGATAQSSLRTSKRVLDVPSGKRVAPDALPVSGDAKRPRREETAKPPSAPEPPKKPTTLRFAPPQLKRPNVSTEDLGAWNTQTTMQHHERRQHSK